MAELEMTFDFGPYFRLLTRKPDPSKMTDDQLQQQLKKVRRLPDNTRPYAGTFVVGMLFTCTAIGYAAMALGAATPAFWLIGSGVVFWKGGGKVLQLAGRRAHGDVARFEVEIEKRRIASELQAQHDLERAERLKAEKAAALVKRAQEAFDSALDEGLPLEKKITVSKSPLKLKPAAQAVKTVFDAETLPPGPGPGTVSDPAVRNATAAAPAAASSAPKASSP